MPAFVWNKGFAIGLAVIDGHHEHLVELIGQLGSLLEMEEPPEQSELERVLGELARYADYHFREEQRLAAQAGLDPRHMGPHRKEHDRFREEVTRRASQVISSRFEMVRDLLSFLSHWLVVHILRTDQAMVRQMAAIQAGMSPAEAFEVHEPTPDPATAALLSFLDWSFELVSTRNDQLHELDRTLEDQVAERTRQLLQAKEALAIKERRYRLAVDSSQDGFWVTDNQGLILDANESYASLSGYTRAELASMRIPDLEAQEHPEETAAHLQQVRTRGYDRFESLHRTKDGRIWPVEVIVTSVPEEDGRMYVFLRDITQRKAALQAITESEHRFRTLFHDAPVGHALNRLADGWFLEVNQAFAAIVGYQIEELNALSYWDLTPKEYEAQEAEQLQSLQRQGRYGPYEKEYLHKDGRRIPVRLHGSRIIDLSGTELILSLVEDLSKELAAERELAVALGDVKALSGLLPICASCKKIRDDHGYWTQIEAYLTQHSEANFTHGICPDCAKDFY